jgi:hypothetical protein
MFSISSLTATDVEIAMASGQLVLFIGRYRREHDTCQIGCDHRLGGASLRRPVLIKA